MAAVAKALGDPVRLQLVDVLRKHAGKVCVCELVPLFDLSQPTRLAPPQGAARRGPRRLRAARAVGLLLRPPRRPGGALVMAELTDSDVREPVAARPLLRHESAARRAAGARAAARLASRCAEPRGCGERAARRAGRRGGFGATLYGEEARPRRPKPPVTASLGCGVPTAVADLHEGETVLDLGSGAGADVLISARRVGPTGRAIGLDMTDEMLELARAQRRRGRRRQRRVPQGLHRGACRSPTTRSTS